MLRSLGTRIHERSDSALVRVRERSGGSSTRRFPADKPSPVTLNVHIEVASDRPGQAFEPQWDCSGALELPKGVLRQVKRETSPIEQSYHLHVWSGWEKASLRHGKILVLG